MKVAAIPVLAAVALAAPAAVAITSPASALAARTSSTAAQIWGSLPVGRSTGASDTATVIMHPLDVASDKAAISAYATYLTGLLKDMSAGETSVTGFESSVSTNCRGALSPLTQSQGDTLSQSAQATLKLLGEELGDDLSITFDEPAFIPFERFSTSLSQLRWTHASGGGEVTRRFLTAEVNVLAISTSDLCRDALLAAVSPSTAPWATKNLVKLYGKASSAANLSLTNLLKLMQTYELPSERGLITHIAGLAGQIAKITKSYLPASSSSLLAMLESP